MSNSSKKLSRGFKDKTGFDFVQLFLFPLLLAFAGYFFQYFQQQSADERYREEALQLYYKDMRELMLEKNLRVSNSRDEVRSIARARTLSVLRQLDTQRKGLLTLFLKESNLITSKEDDERNPIRKHKEGKLTAANPNGKLFSQAGIISMSGANLESTDLKDMDLRYVSFWYTKLKNAHLEEADLRHANLSKANLEGAHLDGANLESANLDGANLDKVSMRGTKFCKTTMPDGTINSDNCDKK
jgi:Pentapeptide repeats (8 copies)